MARLRWALMVSGITAIAIVLVGLLGPIKFDLNIGLTPIWLRKNSTSAAAAPAANLQPSAHTSEGSVPPARDDQSPEKDLLTITIVRGTPIEQSK